MSHSDWVSVPRCDRREFVRLAASAAAFTATAGAAGAAPLLGRSTRPSLAVSTAFVSGPEVVGNAFALPGGDGDFLRHDVKVEIDGFTIADERALPLDLVLRLLWPVEVEGVMQTIPVIAAVQRAGLRERGTVCYRLPLDAAGAIALELIAGAAGDELLRKTIRLGVTSAPGVIPLRSGTYAIAVHRAADGPDWQSLRLGSAADGGAERLIDRRGADPEWHTAMIRITRAPAID